MIKYPRFGASSVALRFQLPGRSIHAESVAVSGSRVAVVVKESFFAGQVSSSNNHIWNGLWNASPCVILFSEDDGDTWTYYELPLINLHVGLITTGVDGKFLLPIYTGIDDTKKEGKQGPFWDVLSFETPAGLMRVVGVVPHYHPIGHAWDTSDAAAQTSWGSPMYSTFPPLIRDTEYCHMTVLPIGKNGNPRISTTPGQPWLSDDHITPPWEVEG